MAPNVQGGPQSYRIPSMNYTPSGFDSKSVPNHSHLSGLTIRLNANYDVAGGAAILKDGYLDQLLQTITFRRGGTTYFRARGLDLHWLHQILQKEPHGLTQFTAGAGASQTVGSPAQMDIEVPIPRDARDVKAELELTWGSDASMGTGYTINTAQVNGSYNFSDTPPAALRVVMLSGCNNKTGTQNQVEIPVEGQLVGLLIVARATAAPSALRDPANALLQVRIEGVEKYEIDWLDAKEDYKNYCNLPAVQTGVAMLLFRDLPMIGGSSYLYIDSDGTATDFNCYGLYTAGASRMQPKESTLDTLRTSGAASASVSGTMGLTAVSQRKGGGYNPAMG